MTTLDRPADSSPTGPTGPSGPTSPVAVPTARRAALAERLVPLTAPVFVVASLAGNSLTESTGTDSATAAGLAARAGSTAFRLGVVLELFGLVALAGFVAWAVLRARLVAPVAAAGAAVAGTVAVSLKLGSGAVLLGGIRAHDDLDDAAAAGLSAANGAAFELFWIGFGALVVSLSVALRALGVVGRPTAGTGLVLGLLTGCLGVIGAVAPSYAVPVPFLLGLLWTAVAGIRAAVHGGSARE